MDTKRNEGIIIQLFIFHALYNVSEVYVDMVIFFMGKNEESNCGNLIAYITQLIFEVGMIARPTI